MTMVEDKNLKIIADPVTYELYPKPGGSLKPRCSLDFIVHDTPLDDNVVHIQTFHGQEGFSQPYQYSVVLHANDDYLKKDPDAVEVLVQSLLGKSATVRVGLPETYEDLEKHITYPENCEVSFFNGIVSSVSMKEAGVYELSLVPDLWKLTITNDYRVFSNQSIKSVIEYLVTEKHGLEADYTAVDGEAIWRKQDWMQAGETDYEFIQRLMGKASIYYYFVHTDTSNKIIFANNPSYQATPPSRGAVGKDKVLNLYYTFSKQQSLDEDDYIMGFQYKENLTTRAIRNTIAQPDPAWLTVFNAGLKSYRELENMAPNSEYHHYQIFQYGSDKQEVESFASKDEHKLTTSRYELTGATTSPTLKPGYYFRLQQSKKTPVRADVANTRPKPILDGRYFTVKNIQHQADVAGSYQNNITAIAYDGLAVDFDIHHTHMGSILARVVRKDGTASVEHLHYLQKSEFVYDSKKFYSQSGSNRQNPGLYVRPITSPPDSEPIWVKLSEQMQTIPEEGVIVTIGRSNDDNEIPEIQGIIQSKGNKVILPTGNIDSTHVGDSHSTSYGDNTSISYGKNKAVDLDKAISIVETQRQSGKFNTVSYGKSDSYSENYVDLSESKYFGGKQISYSEIGWTESESHIGTSLSKSTVDYTKSDSVIGTTISDSKITTSESTSDVGTSDSTSTVGYSNSVNTVGTSDSTGTTGISNSANATGLVNSASATGMVNSASATGMSTSVSATGISNSASVTGMVNSISGNGMVNSISGTLLSNSISSTLTSNSVSSVLTSNSINNVLNSNSISTNGLSNSISISGVSNSIAISGLSNKIEIGGAYAYNIVLDTSSATMLAKFVNGSVQIQINPSEMKVKVTGFEIEILVGMEMTL